MKNLLVVLAVLVHGLFTASTLGASITLSSADIKDTTIIAGVRQYRSGLTVRLDATMSGEAVRAITLPLILTVENGAKATDITNVRLYDGNTAVTTGFNALNPIEPGAQLIVLDGSGLIVAEGIYKTLTLRFDLRTAATGTFQWSVPANLSAMQASGLTTATKVIPELMGNGKGPLLMAVAHGEYAIEMSSASEWRYRVLSAGRLDVPIGTITYIADNVEDLEIRQTAFALISDQAYPGSTFWNRRVSLFDGDTQIGEALFFPNATVERAVARYVTPFRIPKGTSRTVVAKADLEYQDVFNWERHGIFVNLAYDGTNVGINGNYAVGSDSGANISGPAGGLIPLGEGIRVFRNVPEFAFIRRDTTGTSGDSALTFDVVNPDSVSDLAIKKLSFKIVTGPTITGSAFQLRNNGVLANTVPATNKNGVVEIFFDSNTEAKRIPAGGSAHFELILESRVVDPVAFSNHGLYLQVEFLPDLAVSPKVVGTVADIENGPTHTDNIIWTPFTRTSPTASAWSEEIPDWTNGYGLKGLPPIGSPIQEVLHLSHFRIIKEGLVELRVSDAITGYDYELESTEDLSSWKSMGAKVRAIADEFSVQMPVATTARQFFRLKVVP